MLANLSKAKSEIKKKSFYFSSPQSSAMTILSLFLFSELKIGAKKMELSGNSHDKGAGDVFTVPRLNTAEVSTVPVVFLPRRHEWTKIKPKQPNPLSSLPI